jgi:hypothetical protein
MRRRAFALGAMAAPMLLGCEDPSKVVDYRYRLKVVVGSDAQQWQGESVIRVRWHDVSGDFLHGYNRFRITVWAEAVVVDCGVDAGCLFALLARAAPDNLYAAYAFPRFVVGLTDASGDEYLTLLQRMTSQSQEFEVPRSEWPMLVRFGNLENPETIEQLSPNLLPQSFGTRATVQRITMQITDAPVTTVILSKLPWLSSLSTNLAGGGTLQTYGSLPQRLGVSDFLLSGSSF